jgi:hypothetical protein
MEASFDVTVRFERQSNEYGTGFTYYGIEAETKRKAIKIARRRAEDDGHIGQGLGRMWFSAKEA